MKLGTRKIKQKSKKITQHKRRKIKKMKIEEKAKGEEGLRAQEHRCCKEHVF